MRKLLITLSFASISLYSLNAFAHIELTSPAPRQTEELKNGPCGNGPSEVRSQNVTTYAPGAEVTIKWDETINHPSHYVISFSANGTDDFVYPTDADDKARTELPVLLDGIADEDNMAGTSYESTITLPMEECDNCTLQLIQVMYDKPWAQAFYHQCADIVIAADGTDPIGTGGADAMGAGGSGAGASGGSDAMGAGGSDVFSTGGAIGTGGFDNGIIQTNSGGMSAGAGGMSAAGGSTPTGAGGAETVDATANTEPLSPTPDSADDGSLDEGGCSIGGPGKGSMSLFFLALPLVLGWRRRFLLRN